MSAGTFTASFAGSGYAGLKSSFPKALVPAKDSVAWRRKTVSNGSKTHCMKTWNPIDNKKFETLSYLPPPSDESIAKEIDYMITNGWIPCLEFDEMGQIHRENSKIPGYYDGRYWTLWKLPMFGCNDSSQVLHEIMSAKKCTRMLISAAWHSTTRNRFSSWPFSFRNLVLPKCAHQLF